METRKLQKTPNSDSQFYGFKTSGKFVNVRQKNSIQTQLNIELSDLQKKDDDSQWENEMRDFEEKEEVGSVAELFITLSPSFDFSQAKNLVTFNRVVNLLLKHAATIQHFCLKQSMFFYSNEMEIREFLTKLFLPLSELESITIELQTREEGSNKPQFQRLCQIVGSLAESHTNLNAFQKLKSLNFKIGKEHHPLEEMQRLADSILLLQNLESIQLYIEVEGVVWEEIPLLFNRICRLSNLKRIFVQVAEQKTDRLFKEEDVIKYIRPFASIANQIEEFSWDVPCLFQSEDNIACVQKIIGSLVNASIINLFKTTFQCPSGNFLLPFLRLKKLERLSINLSKCDLESENNFREITAFQNLEWLHICVTTTKSEDVKNICEMLMALKESLQDIKLYFHERLKYEEVCLLGETLIQFNRTKPCCLKIGQKDRLNQYFQTFQLLVDDHNSNIDQTHSAVQGNTTSSYSTNQIELLVSFLKISYLDIYSKRNGDFKTQSFSRQPPEYDFRYVDIQSEISGKLTELKEIPSVIRRIYSFSLSTTSFINVPTLELIRLNSEHLLYLSVQDIDQTAAREIVEVMKLCHSLETVILYFKVNKQAYVDSVLSSSKNLMSVSMRKHFEGEERYFSVRSEQVFSLPYLTNLNVRCDINSLFHDKYFCEKKKSLAQLVLYEKFISPHLIFQKKNSHLDLYY